MREKFYGCLLYKEIFVWNERKIADFLDSLYKGYPVGVITLIKTKHDFPKLPVEDRNDDNSSEEKFYVIDGQQRITSLLLMKNNGGEEKWELSRSRKIISRNYIGYNPEETEIKFITRRGTNVANVLKKAIDYQEIKDDKGKEMAKRILDYKIPMSIINLEFESDEDTDKIYEDIADMFIRVNSSGVRIGSIEMFLSFFSGAFDKNDIKAKINEIHVRLDKNYSIDLEPILRFIFWRLGITQNDFKPKKFRGAIIKLKEKLKVERKDIIGELNKCEQVIENTFKFFSEELGLNKSVVERFCHHRILWFQSLLLLTRVMVIFPKNIRMRLSVGLSLVHFILYTHNLQIVRFKMIWNFFLKVKRISI